MNKKSIIENKLNNITDMAMFVLKKKLNEGMYKMPKSIKGRMNQIYNLVNKLGLSSKKFYDESWAALRLYDEAISSLGYELDYWVENGGYGDYDEYTHMATSKTYDIRITCEDGVQIGGYIKMMAAGSVADPFDAYDTCMVLWPERQ